MAEKPVDQAELQRLGLYDPDDEHAAERLELIEYLLGLGATVEDLVDSRDDLPYVASLVTLRLEVLQTFVAGKVNLAARTVKLADPGSVLVSAEVRDATNDYAFTPVGAQRLKGFDEPIELFRLERAPQA